MTWSRPFKGRNGTGDRGRGDGRRGAFGRFNRGLIARGWQLDVGQGGAVDGDGYGIDPCCSKAGPLEGNGIFALGQAGSAVPASAVGREGMDGSVRGFDHPDRGVGDNRAPGVTNGAGDGAGKVVHFGSEGMRGLGHRPRHEKESQAKRAVNSGQGGGGRFSHHGLDLAPACIPASRNVVQRDWLSGTVLYEYCASGRSFVSGFGGEILEIMLETGGMRKAAYTLIAASSANSSMRSAAWAAPPYWRMEAATLAAASR